MNWTRRQVLQAGAAAGIVGLAGPLRALVKPFEMKPFRVVFFSDTHVNLGRNLTENRQMLAEITALKPDFAINAGDITDNAWRNQIELYLGLIKDLPFSIHHCPGNHDVRWSPLGMQIFEEFFGKPYRAFEHQGCWFILLNTTVPLSHWGNIASPQLQWLQETIKKIDSDAPVFMFGHHWIGRESMDTARPVVQVDNEQELIALFRNHNVVFWGNGHGHSDIEWECEGVYGLMNRGLYQFSYTMLEMSAEGVLTISRRTAEKPSLNVVKTVDTRNRRRVDVPNLKILDVTAESLVLSGAVSEFRYNEGIWQKANSSRISAPPALEGVHVLSIRRSPSADRAAGVQTLEVTQEDERLRLKWSAELSGGVMSHAVKNGDSVFLSQMDGGIVCLSARTGRQRWKAMTGSYCHSTPWITENTVYVGSSDGHLYALRRRDGRLFWRTKLPGPVYASPAVVGDTVFIANYGAFFGLDAKSGKQMWRTAMPESNAPFAQSRAATDGSCFVQGCWDSHLYCLETNGKLRWRKPCQERTFAFSPAIGSAEIHEESVYVVANGNGLFRFDLMTGEKLWEVASSGQKFGHSGPCVVENRVFAGNLGDGEGEVRCMATDDGAEIWAAKTGFTIYDSHVRDGNGFVTVLSVPGVLNLLEIRSGKVLAQTRLGRGHALSTAAVDGNQIFAASFAQRAFCWEFQGG